MYKKLTAILIALMTLVYIVTPAGAITFGEPDGELHPNVGLTLTDLPGDGELFLGCSGTLISPTVFLTAGHCTSFLAQFGTNKTWITFDSEYIPNKSVLRPVTGIATHPDYDPHTVFNDVGVIILAEPVPDVTPGILPPENLLGQMKASGALRDHVFVNVGYGATADFKGNPPTFPPRDGVRRFSKSPYLNLTPINLGLLGNHDATGEGSICGGDSGGPHFLGDSNIIVSVTSWGDAVCRALDMSQRVDTPSVLAFLRLYVTQP